MTTHPVLKPGLTLNPIKYIIVVKRGRDGVVAIFSEIS
jgi:hypothetical protein